MKKFAVITGASRGIGKAITEDFIRKAEFDVMAIVRTPSLAEHLRDEWAMLNPACRLVIKVADFSDADAVQTLCHDLGKTKNLALLINNAGIFMPGTTDIEYQNLLDMTEVNFFAPFLLTQAVSHAMQKNKQGYIINIASNAARRAIFGIGAYSASKHALLGLSSSLMLELLPHNIKVTNINPGFTNTDMTRHFPNLADDEKIQPQDIVNCISFLLSLSPGAIIPNIDVEWALLNKSNLDKTSGCQPFTQAIRTLSGMPARVILFKARIMAIASPTCAWGQFGYRKLLYVKVIF